MWLKPPPESIQPISLTPGLAWQMAGGSAESTVVPVTGSVHRYVPPTAVTSGSEAGQLTVGKGKGDGFFTGVFGELAEPPSPELASTVTPLAAAEMNACRRFSSDCVLLKLSSAAPKLCVMTVAWWLSTMNCSAFIIAGKPCTPSVSAGLVVTLRMLAFGAMACAHSTSRAVSTTPASPCCWPVPLLPGGGDFTWVCPFQYTCWNVGIPAPQAAPGSPHMCGRLIWVSKLARSEAMLGLPNESMMAIVTPWPSSPSAYSGGRL